MLEDAATRALLHGDPDLVADAAYALLQLGATTETGRLHERAIEIAERALDMLGGRAQRALVAAALSLTHSMNGNPQRCRELFVDAEAAATRPDIRRRVLPFAYLALGLPADLRRREQLAAELIGLARVDRDAIGEFEGLHLLFTCSIQRGDGRRLREVHDRMQALGPAVNDVGRRWALHYQAAAIAQLDGDLERSEAEADAALHLLAPSSPTRALAAHAGQLLVLRWRQGRLAELGPAVDVLVADQPLLPAWRAAAALIAAHGGESERTVAELRALRFEDDTAVPHDFTWLALTLVAGEAAAMVGAHDDARVALRRLAPWADRVCWQGTCSYGPVARTLAALHRSLGEESAAAVRDATAAALDARLALS